MGFLCVLKEIGGNGDDNYAHNHNLNYLSEVESQFSKYKEPA